MLGDDPTVTSTFLNLTWQQSSRSVTVTTTTALVSLILKAIHGLVSPSEFQKPVLVDDAGVSANLGPQFLSLFEYTEDRPETVNPTSFWHFPIKK